MTRRSPRQSTIDDRAFPVRLRLRAPDYGFGEMFDAWLDAAFGRGNWAAHSGGRGPSGADTLALHVRHPEDGTRFLAAHPHLVLADDTGCVTYSSPHLPFGRADEEAPVCNLYTITRSQDAMRQLFGGVKVTDRLGNLEAGRIYPDQVAPIVRHDDAGYEIVRARWGMPSPPSVLKTARDPGVTNVRNLASPHWRRWLGPAHRCLVPLTAFAEPVKGGNQWFAAADPDLPMFFAGIELRGWTSVRKVKDGETTDDLFAFLTCPPNPLVAEIHPKAMPVILTTPEEWETWMSAPLEIACKLQRPLGEGLLEAVATER